MPFLAIHVVWLCRKPCGVSPSLTGGQQASGRHRRAAPQLPGQWPAAALWTMILQMGGLAGPRKSARWAARGVLRADQPRSSPARWGANRSPGTAGGHEATGMPGHAVASTTTSRPSLPSAGALSVAGRAEEPPGLVTVPMVAAVGTEEHVPATAAVLGGAGTSLPCALRAWAVSSPARKERLRELYRHQLPTPGADGLTALSAVIGRKLGLTNIPLLCGLRSSHTRPEHLAVNYSRRRPMKIVQQVRPPQPGLLIFTQTAT